MALGYQARAMLRGLAKLGEPSLLAGLDCGHAAIERNVDLFAGIGSTAEDNSVARFTVASVASSTGAKVGQLLEHPTEGSFRLDRLVDDNTVVRRFVAVEVA